MSGRSRIAQDILDYFAKHPDACDTVEGIANWWRLGSAGKVDHESIRTAIDGLVAEGLVEIVQNSARPCFRIKRRDFE